MNPWQLAKVSEFSHQCALFCFTAKAQRVGFASALTEGVYKNNPAVTSVAADLIPELAWFHSIPNGTRSGDEIQRNIEGGAMKSTGTKPGVLDTFWPLRRACYCGLYIEMKRPSLKSANNPVAGCSDEQIKFGAYVTSQGYIAKVCYTWLEAAEVLQWYYQLENVK